MKTHCTGTTCALRLLAVFVVAATSLAQVQPQNGLATAGTVFPDAKQSSAVKPMMMPSAGGDANIRLGIGDLVELTVYNVPELSARTRVSSVGDLYLPLINDVHVQGLTIEDAERIIERRLEQGGFVKAPHVQLFVAEYASDGVSVLGEVSKPGVYPVLGTQKLFDVISAAGGLSDRAGRSITITHRSQPDQAVTVALSHNLDEHPESNVPIQAGDTIMVRRADVIYVVGEVTRPSGFLMDNNGHLSVLQAIALAGGTTPTAKLSGARIIRKGPTGLAEIPIPLKQLLRAKATDLPLQAEDILFVPTSARKAVAGRTADVATSLATGAGLLAIRP